VGVSFEEIAQVGTTVEQQFGTTGQATTDLTGNILELAKVSGGDATDQANALGDTLSGMGLDASAAGAVMDNLVASNQQFGTSIGDSITALDNMTPALSAMGLSLADGQGLLNAFEQANVDAATASGDLTKAIKNLKPGQNIDDLVAQVGAIEDPILRAKKATSSSARQRVRGWRRSSSRA
jgi:TP901 family phage tail tape measure protein